MPRFDFNGDEMGALLAHLRSLVSGTAQAAAESGVASPAVAGLFQPHPVSLKLQDGRTLEGTLTSEARYSATVLTSDGKFHLLARDGDSYRERQIEPKQDWASYDGSQTGNRYSRLEQINNSNIQRLAPAWTFPVPNAPRLEVTPVVVDGVMYITGPN